MSIFTKIINRKIPAYIIAENENFIAFLDAAPVQMGHTLVIPKQNIDKFFDLPSSLLSEILVFAQPIAKAIELSFSCNRCGLSVVGLEVPHAHIHLIPINRLADMDFSQKRKEFSREEYVQIQQRIINQL